MSLALLLANSVLKDITGLTESIYSDHPSELPEGGGPEREALITALYQEYFDREPDPQGLAMYVDGDWSIAEIENIFLNSDEYFRKNASPAKFATDYGRDADSLQQHQSFGPADYIEALKTGGELNVQNTRLEILDWLRGDTGKRWLNTQHKPGGTPTAPEMQGIGLYDRIEGSGSPNRDINTAWGDYHNDPAAGSYFTHDDLLATRAIKYPDEQIRNVLDLNPDWLRDEDKPGAAGGVYESLSIGMSITPPEPGSITVNRPAASEYNTVRSRQTPLKPTEDEFENITDSLKMSGSFVSKTARGSKRRRPAKKYKQTKDLSREYRT